MNLNNLCKLQHNVEVIEFLLLSGCFANSKTRNLFKLVKTTLINAIAVDGCEQIHEQVAEHGDLLIEKLDGLTIPITLNEFN